MPKSTGFTPQALWASAVFISFRREQVQRVLQRTKSWYSQFNVTWVSVLKFLIVLSLNVSYTRDTEPLLTAVPSPSASSGTILGLAFPSPTQQLLLPSITSQGLVMSAQKVKLIPDKTQ